MHLLHLAKFIASRLILLLIDVSDLLIRKIQLVWSSQQHIHTGNYNSTGISQWRSQGRVCRAWALPNLPTELLALCICT